MPGDAPQSREVASGVVNLGNTCYMNAVLQALAHAPELCLALDHESHRATCPVARRNEERRRNSPSPPSDDNASKRRPPSTRKSKRSGKKSPQTDSEDQSVDENFCTLCEVEQHLKLVHQSRGEPVAPDTFVNGFIDQVAPPWFKLGVQEDSHEFLRLLIDAMQKSCRPNRTKGAAPVPVVTEQDESVNNLYPFKLFRGTVESNVCCDSCHATSATVDPIEDIGLEVTHTSGSALSDLSSAFCKFTKAEPLTGYKCDRCHSSSGRATKESRLASIPPILTLHLKRFRYGSDGKPLPPPSSRRGGREVSQLLGASGSAKIEGHVRFLEIFDLKPFLTDRLSSQVKSMFCRLFAVIVHAGKNSHSGHYVAYVRNLSKNEWWKMDDARVSKAASAEVLAAEAYMLFYRVVDHPVAQQLRAKEAAATTAAAAAAAALREKEEMERKEEEEEEQQVEVKIEEKQAAADVAVPVPAPDDESEPGPAGNRKRKREAPPLFKNGEQWARSKTRLPPPFAKLLRKAEEFISENVEFTPEFYKVIMDEAAKKNGTAPTANITEDNVLDGFERFRPSLIELIYKLATQAKVDGDFFRKPDDSKKVAVETTGDAAAAAASSVSKETKTLIVPVIDANEPFL